MFDRACVLALHSKKHPFFSVTKHTPPAAAQPPDLPNTYPHTAQMNPLFTIFMVLFPIFLLIKGRKSSKKLPPGSLGIPIIGHSQQLLKAMRTNTAEKWLLERIQKYGSISMLTLFGKPTVFIYGKEANKSVFTSDSSTISYSQTKSLKMILGDRCIAELCGQDHKRIRDALLSFL